MQRQVLDLGNEVLDLVELMIEGLVVGIRLFLLFDDAMHGSIPLASSSCRNLMLNDTQGANAQRYQPRSPLGTRWRPKNNRVIQASQTRGNSVTKHATGCASNLLEETLHPAVQDQRTVDEQRRSTAPLLDGMSFYESIRHDDDRGSVTELFDPRWGWHPDPRLYLYLYDSAWHGEGMGATQGA